MDMDASWIRSIDFENFRQASRLNALAQLPSLLRPNDKLENALANSAAKGLPPISVSPLSGTLGGYSAIWLADSGAKVTSIEIDPKHRDVAAENTKGLEVEIILGTALDVLPKLAEEGRQFDMVFIDADFADQWEHFDWAVKLTRLNGCIFLDYVVASMFKDEQVQDGVESILAKVGEDGRVRATLVPTAHSHPMIPTPVFNGHILATILSH